MAAPKRPTGTPKVKFKASVQSRDAVTKYKAQAAARSKAPQSATQPKRPRTDIDAGKSNRPNRATKGTGAQGRRQS